jgi:hypothetical protein
MVLVHSLDHGPFRSRLFVGAQTAASFGSGTRGRNLDPGIHREQSCLLFLLLGRRKNASIAGLALDQ